jgi:predicted small metal-binding protein
VKGEHVAQQFIACRDYIEDGDCSVVIGADTLEELVETAIEHAYLAHGEEDMPALRAHIREHIRNSAAV